MQSEHLASCSVRVFWPFFDYFQERYGRGRELRDQLPFADREQRVPHTRAMHMLEGAMRESGDTALGLHVAEVASHSAFDVLDYVTRTSRTLLEAFERTSTYIRTWVHDGVCFTAQSHGDVVALSLAFEAGLEVVPAAVEFILATLILRFRPLLPAEQGLLEVRFAHQAPVDRAEHERVLKARVSFSAGTNTLILGRAAMERELSSWQSVQRAVELFSAVQPRALADGAGFGQRVRAMIAEDMRAGVPCIEHIGERLHMSPRTVQRRLADEGTNFKALADDVRRSLAEAYVQRRELALSEVSFMLGFANVNAFHRAFRRWTGKTPALYRQTGARR
jgi:AraC-like DNA-binding protein